MRTEQIKPYDSKYDGLYVTQDVIVPAKGIERFLRRALGMDPLKPERYRTLTYFLRGGHKPSVQLLYHEGLDRVVVCVDGKVSPYYVSAKVKRYGRVSGH